MAAKINNTRTNKRKDIIIEEREELKKAYVKIRQELRTEVDIAKERASVKLQDKIDNDICGKGYKIVTKKNRTKRNKPAGGR